MAALRPGNDDKAWNDPPVFAYTEVQGTPVAAAPKRNFLNKRVAFPQDGIKPQNAPSATGTAPPPTGQAISSGLLRAARSGDLTEASIKADQKEAEGVNDSSKAALACAPENLIEETLSNLNKAAIKCAQDMEMIILGLIADDIIEATKGEMEAKADKGMMKIPQTCQEFRQGRKRKQDDVRKRLDVLKSVWEQGKLSLPVQQRMHELALELLNGNHEKANALHVSLMVDYVSEVSQWMLGIKHLIIAAQAAQEKPASDAQEST